MSEKILKMKKDVYVHYDSGEIIKTEEMEYGDTYELCCGLTVIKTPYGLEILE